MRRGPEPTLQQALSDAALVVHATVESAESAWVEDEWGKHIWTTYRLRARTYMKGPSRGDILTLRILGGTVGDRSEVVFDLLRPSLFQEAVFLFSVPREDGALALERSLPVVGDEVQLDRVRVPLGQFGEAVARLTLGEAGTLEQILQQPIVATLPAVFDNRSDKTSALPTPNSEGSRQDPKQTLYAVMYDAWWSNTVDNDGDGYAQSRTLTWDADVYGGSGSLTVYFEVYASPSGAGAWALLGSIGPHTLTGTSSSDTASMGITGSGAPASYDFAIVVYRQGSSTPDDSLDPTEDSDLWAVRFEGADYDSAPTITSISPSRGSAGTNTQVTIDGSGFGSTQGVVVFFFQDTGDPLSSIVPGDTVSWSDNRIVCTVPICAPALGECGGYGGGASSGPVWVMTSGGVLSNPFAFNVSFSFGGRKWNPALVNYYISASVPADFSDAIENAFSTWASAAGISFNYAGPTTGSTTSNNGVTELMYGQIPPGLPQYLAYAMCWPQGGSLITECDMLINSDYQWSTATPTPDNYYDVESVSLHEFGHWLMLLDLYGNQAGYPSDTAKVMFGFGNPGPQGMKRTLHPDDAAGAQWIYPGSGCTYSISPTSTTIAAAGGSGSVNVTTQTGCSWTATSNASWITITGGSSGTGSGTVSYSVGSNSGASTRTGTLTIAGSTFTVTQSAAGAAPVANFTWTPTNPTPGQTVQFTDTSTGSPTSWSWSFGDGGTSTMQNPTHQFSAAGTYSVRLTVTNTSGSDQETKTVTVASAGTPPTASFTWAPASPTAGQAVTFTDTSTGSPTSWSWAFGDGATSTQRNPTHAYSTAGTYSVRLTATNAYGSDQETRSITVRPTGSGSDGEPVFVPASAHAAGAAGTFFVTDLRIFNPGDSVVTADLYFTPSGTTTRQHAVRVVNPRQVLYLADVVLDTFGQSSAVGAIEVRPSGGAVMVASRTYNTAASGTYGQFIDGRPASEAVGQGAVLHLLQIAKSSLFRANVGFCETTGSTATVRVRMFDDQGTELGSRSYDLGAYGFRQINDVFNDLGVSARDNVRVTVEVTAGSGRILAYASVVDNLSSDQICVPAQVAPSSGEALFIAAGASGAGAQGSLWRTDIRVANVATSSRTVRISLLPSGQDNSSPASVTYSLAPGRVLALDDVVQSSFGQSGNAGLMVDTSPPGQGGLTATSRTYNVLGEGNPQGLPAGSTFGQFIPALEASHGLSQGDGCVTALQVDRSAAFRANVGFVNASTGTGSVTVDLISSSGAVLGSRSYTLKAYSPYQINDVFNAFSVSWQDNARVDFSVSGSGKVIGYASVIDNGSNDPVCVMAKRWPEGGSTQQQPDLTPTTPSGWSGSIVVSTVAGTNTDGAPIGGQPAYVDVAVRNVGSAATGAFSVQLKVDGTVSQTWSVPSLAAGATWTQLDHTLTLAAGSHTLQLVADSANAVTESNEGNNTASRTFTWGSAGQPDLTPTTPAGWSDAIVVSTVTGTNTDGQPVGGQPAYIDVAVKNIGSAAAGGFSVQLKVDGSVRQTWSVPSLAAGATWTQLDYAITLSAGTHTGELVVDSGNAVAESNESNNSYSRTGTWASASLPDLVPWPPTPYNSAVVVSNSQGATTTSSYLTSGTTYFSWFVGNAGAATASTAFKTGLYINGELYYYCDVNAGLLSNYATGCLDAPLDMPAGTYTVSTTVDYENTVTESDEQNNSWSVVLTWH